MIDNRTSRAHAGDLTRDEACREWLGVRREDPTHYELLGLSNLTSDAKTIFEAGRQAKRRLRPYQIGPYRDLALKLLADVGRAVSVLTNAEKKGDYDNRLVRDYRETIERLYEQHCQGRPQEPAVLETWLAACRDEGVPIVRLMPWWLRRLTGRIAKWPEHGEHGLSLPACLGIYRDVVVLGQCLADGDIAKRAQVVKRVQKALNIPEGLARLVAEEVSRSLPVFSGLRFVRQARAHPTRTILRLARRIRRHGGHLDRRSKVLTAAATLLQKSRHDLMKVMDRMEEPAVEISAARRMALAARRAQQRARLSGLRASTWVSRRPQLLLGVGLLIGALALALALLVLLGVWQVWELEEPEAPVPPGTPETPAPGVPSRPGPPPDEAPPPDWERFLDRYPANGTPDEAP